MIGEYLTRCRNEAGVSIEDLSKRTRIRLYYLRALEKEEFHKIPGETYVKGHIQTYLKALGLDPSEGLRVYHGESNKVQTDTHSVTKTNDFISIKTDTVKPVKSYKYLNAVIIILIACPVVYFLYSHKFKSPRLKTDIINKAQTNIKEFIDTVNSSNHDNTPQAVHQTVPQPAKDTSAQVTQVQQPAVSPSPVATNAKRHTLSLKASDLTWLSVKIDGKETKQMFLKPLETVQWVADDNFVLKLGNAGGVKIVFDGKELDGYGQKGSVVTLELPPKPTPSEVPNPE
ncbi:MAG: helix-turn-helix domain-containing protein [Nitrospirae bacterium]|nr:helix-turn-helix domain-containing protein [Nitrospirota bacterium]MBF0535565.1 helix-turn-helix domain-containing protein [Nitrospirota bacterium]MBF0617408.1 helix-turn-helix domain-containing protein [Nitrospirota bacterium]